MANSDTGRRFDNKYQIRIYLNLAYVYMLWFDLPQIAYFPRFHLYSQGGDSMTLGPQYVFYEF